MNALKLNANSVDDISNQCSLFRDLAEEISKLAATVNIKIIPFYDENLIHFNRLDNSLRKNILSSLQIYLNVYKAVENEGSSLLDTGRVIWNALAQHGYRPTSDLFSFVNSGNVIEIHDDSLVQVFRNLNFFNYCSYSIEELYCYSLHQLYARDQIFEARLMEYIKKLLSGFSKSVIKTELNTHIISELASKDKLQITDDIHYMAPLFSTSGGVSPVAFITIETARIKEFEPQVFVPTADSQITP